MSSILDKDAIVRVIDTATLAPALATGREDQSKTDYLKITANGAALATNIRSVTLTASNDDATVVGAVPVIAAQGGLHGVIVPSATANPTWAAWMKGMLLYNNTDNKLYIATNAAWVVVGTQV